MQASPPMDWFEPLDQYCERLGPGFWAEPLNAVSNASFIIAGIALFLQWRRTPGRPITGLLLVLNVFAVGIGSFLFHTLANRWSELADVMPIAIFIHLYLFLALHKYIRLKWWQAAGLTAAFFAVSPFLAARLAPAVGSSAFYLPALLAIFGVSLAARSNDPKVATRLRDAGLVFALSIVLRSADASICASLPTGSHMVWHLLNGVVLYLLVRLYLSVSAAPATS